MAPNTKYAERPLPAQDRDPREDGGAEIIDLATRNVMPVVTQRKRGDGFGLVAGIAIVAALGLVTLWSLDSARNASEQAQAPTPSAQPQAAAPATAPQPVLPSSPQSQPVARPLPAPAPAPVLAAPPQAAGALAPDRKSVV